MGPFPTVAPNTSVQGVVLMYNTLKMEIVVAWAPLVTQPPEGEVALYEVQYGLSNSSLNTFRAYPPANSVILDGVTEDYQVNPSTVFLPLPATPLPAPPTQARVRAGVKVTPESFDYSQWSVWVMVSPPTCMWSDRV